MYMKIWPVQKRRSYESFIPVNNFPDMPCCPSIIERSRSSQRMSKTEISSDDPLGLEQQQDNRHSRTSSKFGKVILGVTGAAAIGLVLVTTPFVTPALRKICLPYVPATERQISNILLMAQVSKCPGSQLVDLGSGDGRVVCIYSKLHFHPKSSSVDLSRNLLKP